MAGPRRADPRPLAREAETVPLTAGPSRAAPPRVPAAEPVGSVSINSDRGEETTIGSEHRNRLIHGFFARPRRGVPDVQGRRAHRCSRVPSMRRTVRNGIADRATASPSTASAEDSANDDDEVKERTGFREKFLFYIGIFLILLGGPGIALGSWLHDMLRISVGEFTAFDAFGPWNRLVTAIGLIVLIVGIVCLILSLRFSRPSDVEKDLNALRQS